MDVVPIVTEAVSDLREAYPAATVRLDAPASLEARAAPQLAAAIRELVENAAKHAGETPVVEVTVTEHCDSVEIRVADNGPGLPEQERSVLESGEETALNHGSGLGLWLVYAVVENVYGQLRVDDDQGSTAVTIVLQSDRSAS